MAEVRLDSLRDSLEAQGERLDHCVHCGFCLPVCPTYLRLGDEADSPRGRLHLMRAVAERRLDAGSPALQTHLDRCLGCRACEPVCPSGVEYGHLLERARAVIRTARPTGRLTRLLLWMVERPFPFAVWMGSSRLLRGSRVGAVLLRVLPVGAVGGLLERARFGLAMLEASRAVPLEGLPARGGGPAEGEVEGARGSFQPSRPEEHPREEHRQPEKRPRVGVLVGCVQEGLFSRVNRATVRVLEANGFQVVPVPGQGCCGALHAHSGALEAARRLARKNVAAFEAAGVEEVAVNAAGCGAAMKEYGELLAEDPEWADRAQRVAERVRDVSEVLAGEGRTLRAGAPLPVAVAYDPPCHLLHAQRVADAPFRVLQAVPGLTLVPVRDGEQCCGGAGIYGLTHAELGGRIGRDKGEALRESGAELVATGNPGCHIQIGAVLRLTREGVAPPVGICHPVELLDASYRRAGWYDAPERRPPIAREES